MALDNLIERTQRRSKYGALAIRKPWQRHRVEGVLYLPDSAVLTLGNRARDIGGTSETSHLS